MENKNDNILIAAAKQKNRIRFLKKTLPVSLLVIITIIITLIFPKINQKNNNNSNTFDYVDNEKKITPIEHSNYKHFNTLLETYTSNIKLDLEKYKKNKYFGKEITLLKEQLDLLFNEGQTTQNNKIIQDIEEKLTSANSLILKIENQVSNIKQTLQDSARALDLGKFNIELENLSQFDSNDTELVYWNNNQNQLLEYSNAYNNAIRANAENRTKEELAALKKINSIPIKGREFYEPIAINRINQIESIIIEDNYQAIILNVREQLRNGDYSTANQFLLNANDLIPNRKETEMLQQDINKKINEMLVNNLNAKASNNISLDQWENALINYKNALLITPNNKEALNGQEASEIIIKLKKQLKSFINDPLKVKDREVLRYTQKILRQSSELSIHSKSLNELETNAKNILANLLVPRSIWLESDNKTRIEIKGIGYISPTKRKLINLIPGEYQFHAECKGYQAKIYNVIIEIQSKTTPLRITCGEPI